MADTIDDLLDQVIASGSKREPASAPASGAPQPQQGQPPNEIDALLDQVIAGAPKPDNSKPYFPPGHPMTPFPADQPMMQERTGWDNVNDAFGGVYSTLANALTLPVDAVMQAFNKVGGTLPFDLKGGDARAYLKSVLRAAGVNAPDKAADNFYGKMGENAAINLITTGAMRAAAPAMSAAGSAPGAGNVAKSVAQIGDEIIKRPVTNVVGAIGAAPGQTYGEQVGAGMGAPGSLASETGKLIGGVIGGTITAVPTIGVSRKIGDIPLAERVDLQRPAPGPAIKPAEANPDRMRTFSEDMISRELAAIDTRVGGIVDGLGRPWQSPHRAAEFAHQRLSQLEANARVMEQREWAPVNRLPLTAGQLTRTEAVVSDILASQDLVNHPTSVPQDIALRIMRVLTEPRATGSPQTTVQELNSFRSEALREIRENAGGTAKSAAPDRMAQSYYNRIQAAILEDISAAHAGNPQVARAREISRNFNTRFRTGPVGEALSTDYRGADNYDPIDAMRNLYAKVRGPQRLAETMDPLSNVPAQGARVPHPVTGADRLAGAVDESLIQEYKKVLQDAMDEAALTAPVRDIPANRTRAAAVAAGREARKLVDPADPRIDSFARAHQAVRDSSRDLQAAWREREAWLNSSLASATSKPPEAVVADVFSAANPRQAAATLATQLQRDTVPGPATSSAALDGFHVSLVDHFWKSNRTAGDMAAALKDPRRGGVLEDQLGAARFNQLKEAVKVAEAVEKGTHISAATRLGHGAQSFMAHMIGLSIGRPVAQMFGTGGAGSLSVPFKMAKFLRQGVETANKVDAPSQIIAQAIVDPKFLANMQWKLPGSPREALMLSRQQQMWARRISMGINQGNDKLVELTEGREDR